MFAVVSIHNQRTYLSNISNNDFIEIVVEERVNELKQEISLLRDQIELLVKSQQRDLTGHNINSTNQENRKQLTNDEYLWNGEEVYLQTARSFNPITDKVMKPNGNGHTYNIMYGRFLLPYYHQHPQMKMLEIGLGCDMKHGPGASTTLYKKLFPQAELWEAEYDEECVKNSRKESLVGFHVLTGDQGDVNVLDRWIEESGGDFDVIIDDGGHENCQIWTSFLKLWDTVKPGGLYFIEDMQVAKLAKWRRAESPLCSANTTVPDNLKIIMNDLIYRREDDHYEFSSDIKFIFCQSEACVLGKNA